MIKAIKIGSDGELAVQLTKAGEETEVVTLVKEDGRLGDIFTFQGIGDAQMALNLIESVLRNLEISFSEE